MTDLVTWIGGDPSCYHISRHVLSGGNQLCTKCQATGIQGASRTYTQADLDAAVAAALREAVSLCNSVDPHDRPTWANAGTWAHCAEVYAMRVSALIPDAGAALDRALAAEREAGKGEMLNLYERVEKEGGCGETAMRMSIRAQGDKT